MKRASIICIILVIGSLSSSILFGQELEIVWERLYGDADLPPDSTYFMRVPFSLFEHDDYGFVVGSWYEHSYWIDAETTAVWIFQADWEGDIVWEYWLEEEDDLYLDRYNQLEKTTDGEHLLLVRTAHDNGQYFPMLIWLDWDGMEFRRRTYPTIRFEWNSPNDLLVADDGKIIILSSSPRFIFILDENGDSLAYCDYSLPREVGSYGFSSICQISENRFLIRGTFHDRVRQQYFPLFIEVDEHGDSLRGRIFDWEEHQRIEKVIPTDRGTLLASGREVFQSGHGADSCNATLMEFDRDWDLLWHRTYNLNRFDYILDLQQLLDGRIVFVGNTGDNSREKNGWLQLIDATGDTLNRLLYREIGSTYFDQCLPLNGGSELIILGEVVDGHPFIRVRTLLMSVSLPPVSAGKWDFSIPNNFAVFPAFPNPFNSATTISYMLPKAGDISLKVFSLSGREVGTLHDGFTSTGQHTALFDASDVPSGVYICRMNAHGRTACMKLVLIR